MSLSSDYVPQWLLDQSELQNETVSKTTQKKQNMIPP